MSAGNGMRPFAGERVVQAALSGYSDAAMRAVARAHGARFCLNEVVLDFELRRDRKLRRRTLTLAADDHPTAGQLMGSDPAGFATCTADLLAAGYDQIDINFGCPVASAAGSTRGGYLLGEPELALRIVDAVIETVEGRVPVTVKMRRGLDDSEGARSSFFRVFDGALARGVAGVTVHGRTVQQKYHGRSRWPFLAEVKAHAGERVVFGSGDLFTPFAVQRMLTETGVDGVTLARGCIGNPFLFGQCEDVLAGRTPRRPSVAAQRAALELHLRHAIEVHGGEDRGGRRARAHAIKYAQIHPDPLTVRTAFVACRTTADLRAVLDRHYAEGAWPDAAGDLREADAIAVGDDSDADCAAPASMRAP